MCSRPAWFTKWIAGQSSLHSEPCLHPAPPPTKNYQVYPSMFPPCGPQALLGVRGWCAFLQATFLMTRWALPELAHLECTPFLTHILNSPHHSMKHLTNTQGCKIESTVKECGRFPGVLTVAWFFKRKAFFYTHTQKNYHKICHLSILHILITFGWLFCTDSLPI